MAGELTAYSFANVVVEIDGRRIEGFFEGDDAVEVTRNADAGTPVTGADGDSTIAISADRSVMIMLRLMPNSIANSVLNAKLIQFQSGGYAPFPISIRDTGNGEGGTAARCAVTKGPDLTFGSEVSSREWTLFANPWQPGAISYTLA